MKKLDGDTGDPFDAKQDAKQYAHGLKAKNEKLAMQQEILFRTLLKRWMYTENLVAVCACSGLAIAIYQHIAFTYKARDECIKVGVESCLEMIEHQRYPHKTFYNWFIIFTNIPTAVIFCISQWYMHQWMSKKIGQNEQEEVTVKSCINWSRFFQMLIILISPIPGHDKIYESKIEDISGSIQKGPDIETQYQSDYIYAFMYLRLFFVLKAYLNTNKYKTQFVKQICAENGFQPHLWFIFKLKLVRAPVTTVLVLFFSSVFIFACLVLNFELKYFLTVDLASLDKPFFTALYFMMVTLSTIGYGDYSPVTQSGRIVIMMASIWGAILLALFVTVVVGLFEMTSEENKAINTVDISRKSAKVIIKAFHYHKAKTNYYLLLKKKNPQFESDFMGSIKMDKHESSVGSDKSLLDLRVEMLAQNTRLFEQCQEFKEAHMTWKKEQDDDTQSQVFTFTKEIKKEVYDTSDTLDLICQFLKKQDARLDRIEKALNKQGREGVSGLQLDNLQPGSQFVLSSHVHDVTNRHTEKYAKAIRRDVKVKGSNRNELLLGKEGNLVNVGTDGQTVKDGMRLLSERGGTESKATVMQEVGKMAAFGSKIERQATQSSGKGKKQSTQKEGGQVDDDNFQRMD